jgi:hypothetical protein
VRKGGEAIRSQESGKGDEGSPVGSLVRLLCFWRMAFELFGMTGLERKVRRRSKEGRRSLEGVVLISLPPGPLEELNTVSLLRGVGVEMLVNPTLSCGDTTLELPCLQRCESREVRERTRREDDKSRSDNEEAGSGE